jgi:hypothetical protein
MPILEDGQCYVDGDGRAHTIGGETRDYPGWCWSTSGFWYVRATGERLTYGKLPSGQWGHYLDPRAAGRLVEAPADAD